MKNNNPIVSWIAIGILFFIGLAISFNLDDGPSYPYNLDLPLLNTDELLKDMMNDLPQLQPLDYDLQFAKDPLPTRKRDLPELLEDWNFNGGEYLLSASELEEYLTEVKQLKLMEIVKMNRSNDGKLLLWNWEETNTKTVLISFPISKERQAFDYWRLTDSTTELLEHREYSFFDADCDLKEREQIGSIDLAEYFYLAKKVNCTEEQRIYKATEDGVKEVFSFNAGFKEGHEQEYYQAEMKWYNEREPFLEVKFLNAAYGDEKSLAIPLVWDSQAQQYRLQNQLLRGFLKGDF
jgi:hypothetical protein